METGYSLPEISGSRLDTAIIDHDALNGLVKLIHGGVASKYDLTAAEMALRAIVLHDSIQENIPVIDVEIQSELVTPGGLSLIEPDFRDQYFKETGIRIEETAPERLQRNDVKIIMGQNYSALRCKIDHLHAFSNGDERGMIQAHNERARKEVKERTDGLISLFSSTASELEFVAESPQLYFGEKALNQSKTLKSYLIPITASGLASYFGNNVFYDYQRAALKSNLFSGADQLFGPLDLEWEKHNSLLSRALSFRLPLFISIVLSRAKSRPDILNVVTEFRDQFERARRELWELFDDADLRIYDTQRAARVLEMIEREASEIIPRALSRRDFNLPRHLGFVYDIAGRAKELMVFGINPFSSLERGLNMARLDSTRILEEHISSIELRGLLERFLSDAELNALEQDAWRS